MSSSGVAAEEILAPKEASRVWWNDIFRRQTMSEKILVRLDLKNLDLKSKLQELIASCEGYQVQTSNYQHQTDLMIIELGADTRNEFQLIQNLLNTGATGEVFVVSNNTDPTVLLQAIKTGITEYFSLPLQEDEIRQALEKFRSKRGAEADRKPVKQGTILNILGSKGGVGTTTIAVNLAVSLAKKRDHMAVALVDMNQLFGDIPLFLEVKPRYHWGEITKNIDRLDSTFLMNVLSRHSSGVHILPSPAYLNGYPVATPMVIEKILRQMQKMFDLIIIDGGQSIDKTSLRTIEISDTVLLVSLLNLPCLSNSTKIIKSFNNLQLLPKDRLRIVVNRYLKKSEISLKDAEKSIRKEIFWTIPNDYKTTMSAINQGRAVSEIASNSEIKKSLQGLADALFPEQERTSRKGWKLFKR
jgi:pilus assembly protein CpaE